MWPALIVAAGAVTTGVADVPGPKFIVIDFGPVGGLRSGPFQHRITISGESAGKRPIRLNMTFTSDKTPTAVRDIGFQVLQKATLPVQKLGDTKVVVGPCKFLGLKTAQPAGPAFPVNCQPSITVFDTEKDALKEK